MIEKLINYLKSCQAPATSIEEALERLLGKRTAVRILAHKPKAEGAVICVARHVGQNKYEVLREVAKEMSLESRSMFHLPTPELLKKVGFSKEDLKAVAAMPQRSPEPAYSYELVVAKPEEIALAEFQAAGVHVALALEEDIAATWERLERAEQSASMELSEEKRNEMLERLIVDCEHLGVNEVELGAPSSGKYRFSKDGENYTGAIPQALTSTLVSRVTEKGFEVELSKHRVTIEPLEGQSAVKVIWQEKKQKPALVLPLHVKEQQQQVGQNSSNLGPPSILLVDDDPAIRTTFSRMLEHAGFQVICKHGAPEAIDYLINNPFPTLIITDVHMPRMDGPAFLSTLRSIGAKSLPIAVLTSDEDELLEAELAELGASVFLRKSQNSKIICSWCKNLARSVRDDDLSQYFSDVEAA